MTPCESVVKKIMGEPYAGNPQVRFEEEGGNPTFTLRYIDGLNLYRGYFVVSMLDPKGTVVVVPIGIALLGGAGAAKLFGDSALTALALWLLYEALTNPLAPPTEGLIADPVRPEGISEEDWRKFEEWKENQKKEEEKKAEEKKRTKIEDNKKRCKSEYPGLALCQDMAAKGFYFSDFDDVYQLTCMDAPCTPGETDVRNWNKPDKLCGPQSDPKHVDVYCKSGCKAGSFFGCRCCDELTGRPDVRYKRNQTR